NLWHGQKLSTHQDLVGLFIVRAAEKYLNDEGTFAFVTPLALLSRQQYEGFRAGIWGDSNVPHLRGEIAEMWDLDKVRPHPFPVPAGVIYGVRHTAGRKGQSDETPHGTPETKVVVEGLRDSRGWAESCEKFTFTTAKNFAISDEAEQSPYRVNVTQGAILSPRTLVFVREETATNPLGQSAGRVSVTSHRTSQEKEPWKSVPSLSGVMQRRYIFDVHLGSTIAPFKLLEPWRAVLPISNAALMDEAQMKSQAPGLAKWWTQANEIWEENKTKSSRLSFLENLDYQSKLTKQLGGGKHRVVYSSSGTALAAAHIDNPNQIIDTTLYWLPVRSREEAQYLVAILNAPATTRAVSHLQSRGLFGARHFHTYVWRLSIPTYDPTQETHCHLVELAKRAEEAASSTDVSDMGFQRARRLIRDKLEKQGIAAQLDAGVTELLGLDV